MSLIGGGHNFMTSMSRSSKDNICGKNSSNSNLSNIHKVMMLCAELAL